MRKMLYEMMIVRNQIMLDHDEKEQKEAEEKGMEKIQTLTVENLLKKSFPIEEIAEIVAVTIEFVLEIKVS